MNLFEEIVNETSLLTEGVSSDNIVKAISGLHPAWISYNDTKGGGGKGRRIIYPIAYGLTKSGNPVVRAFQPSGSSKRGLTTPPNNRKYPKWKYFRLDRITFWRTVNSREFNPEDLVTKKEETKEPEESIDVKNVTVQTLADKVFELLKANNANLFSSTDNGLVPKTSSASSLNFLRADGVWGVPQLQEDLIEVSSSNSYSLNSNANLKITADSAVTIVLKNPSIIGLTVTIINDSDTLTHSLSTTNVEGNTVDSILPNAFLKIAWNGSAWVNITAPAVGSTFTQYPQQKTPDNVYPCTKWSELSYSGAFFRASGGNASSFISEGSTLTAQAQATAKNGLTVSKSGTVSGKSQTVNSDYTQPTFSGSTSAVLSYRVQYQRGDAGGSYSATTYSGRLDSGSSSSEKGYQYTVNPKIIIKAYSDSADCLNKLFKTFYRKISCLNRNDNLICCNQHIYRYKTKTRS